MDAICEDLFIPRQQIKETKCSDRFIIFTHKSWLKYLLKKKKIIEFPIYTNIVDWNDWQKSTNIGHPWTTAYITVSLIASKTPFFNSFFLRFTKNIATK